MKDFQVSKHSHFYMIGIDHMKAPVEVREGFSLGSQEISHLTYEYKKAGGDGIFVLSTCNRTEVYAFADCPRDLIQLFCKHSKQSLDTFDLYKNVKQNRDAIQHLYKVGVGLESKILGDFEIIGQIKKSFLVTKELNAHNSFLERLINNTVQCSKRVKNETTLSSGAASVAHTTVRFIKDYINEQDQPKLLLFGIGKIGQTACENLINQTNITDITLINRSEERAEKLAAKFHVKHVSIEQLNDELDASDVIIVATGAQAATVKKEAFKTKKSRLILDLSMPRNVDHDLYQDNLIQVVDVDHLSVKADESLNQRRTQIPLVLDIIDELTQDFYDWLESRRIAPTLQQLQSKIDEIINKEVFSALKKSPDVESSVLEDLGQQITKKLTGQFARKLRNGADVNDQLRTIHHIFELKN